MAATAVSILPWPEIITTGRSGCWPFAASSSCRPSSAAALQPDIEKDEIGAARGDRAERGIAVMRDARRIALVLQDARNELADVGFVVNDENIGCHDAY